MESQGQVGPQSLADGTISALRIGRGGEQIFSEMHGRFFEQVFRGSVFSIGSGPTALSANTISLTNTTTPIVGVWNPASSSVNLVILQIGLNGYANTLTAPVGPGAFVLAGSVGNAALTLGSAPFNRKTMASSGSQAKGFPGGVALTGLTNNIVVFDGLEIPTQAPPVASGNWTLSQNGYAGVVNLDGSLIVPPGGVLALLNTTSTTTQTVASRLLWEEVPL